MTGKALDHFVLIDDRANIRYAIRPAAVDAVADGGDSRDETVFYLRGGQAVRVKLTMDEVTTWLLMCGADDEEISPEGRDA
jgi:hypothetical protein